MIRKIILLVILTVITFAGYTYFAGMNVQKMSTEQTSRTQYQTLRTIFNNYNQGLISENHIPYTELIVASTTQEGGVRCGLKSFDSSYFKGDFIPISSEDSPTGGKIFNIVFEDKPDKIFMIWLYESSKGWELRSFCENRN